MDHEHSASAQQQTTELDKKYYSADVAAALHFNSYHSSAPVSLRLGNFSDTKGKMGTLISTCPRQLHRQSVLASCGKWKMGSLVVLSTEGYRYIKPKACNPLTPFFTQSKEQEKLEGRRSALFPVDNEPGEYAPIKERLATLDTTINFKDLCMEQTTCGRAYMAKYAHAWISVHERRRIVKDIINAASLKGVQLDVDTCRKINAVYTEAVCQEDACVSTGYGETRGLVGLPPLLFERDTILGGDYLLMQNVIHLILRCWSYLESMQDPVQKKDVGTVLGARGEKVCIEPLHVHSRCMLCSLLAHNKHSEASGIAIKIQEQHGLSKRFGSTSTDVTIPRVDLIPPISIRVSGLPEGYIFSGRFYQILSGSLSKFKTYAYNVSAIARDFCHSNK